MKSLFVFGAVSSILLGGCAGQMAQSSLRDQCAKDGKQVFMLSTSQNGIPILFESGSAMGVCLEPENIGHLPASFGADIVRVQLSGHSGVGLFSVVPASPAEKAGLRAADFIVEFRGKPVSRPDDLQAAIEATSSGERVSLKFNRNGVDQSTTVQF